ncbi:Rv3235 family protein [Mycobacterium yunnanensis]|uniref:Rv3235 family protein n=1 Tax=Mycobacterium yunnanensis TaxID=368477 RepID=UPI003558413C
MTASPLPTRRTSFTTPVVDYEPPPIVVCPAPTSAALHRHATKALRSVPNVPEAGELPVPQVAAAFAETAIRRVLEVSDRRRPVAQLRPLLAPSLFDAVAAFTAAGSREGAAVLRRVRLRSVHVLDGDDAAAEVFASYSRGRRVRAIAGRVEFVKGRWVMVALQVG